MTADEPQTTGSEPTLARQGAGFLVSGLVALGVDMSFTSGLTRIAGLSPYLSRLIGISFAMVVAWILHRRLTFGLSHPPAFAEFLRYAAMAWSVAALNYALYAGLLYGVAGMPPEAALVVASVVAMVVSFLAMKFGVFKR